MNQQEHKLSLKQKIQLALLLRKISKSMEENNMQELLKALDKGLSWLPFNNHKTNIGSLIGWLGVADVFLQASLPLLHTAAPYVPPMYVVAVGAGITGIGAFHKFVKGLLEAQKK